MDQKQPDSPGDNLVRFLNALITTKEPRSLEDLREAVQGMRMDPDRLLARAREQVARAREEARLGWVKRAQTLIPKLRERLAGRQAIPAMSRQERLAQVRRMVQGVLGRQAAELAFKNLESLPDDDLGSLLQELEALRSLEEEFPDERSRAD
jgi:hypothetical protein